MKTLIIEIVVVLLIAVLAVLGVKKVLSWRSAALANAATLQQQNRTGEATVGIAAAADTQQQKAQQLDITVTQARGTYSQQYEELKREDTDVDGFVTRPIPVKLRDIARARRLARDGLGGDAAGHPHDDAGAPSSGTGSTP